MRNYQCQHCGRVYSNEKKPGLCPKGCTVTRTDRAGFPMGYQTFWRVLPKESN